MNKYSKRKVDVLVISDVHLGTYGCHAKELLFYLKSITPKKNNMKDKKFKHIEDSDGRLHSINR